jgi:hypothetical protein
MEMLNDIISNDFIDDRLSKFLNILSGGADAEILNSDGNQTPNLSPLTIQ